VVVCGEQRAPELPRARRHGLLERPGAGFPFGDDEDVEAGRERLRQARRQGGEIDVGRRDVAPELDVDVFGDRFGTRRERQTEADLGRGVNPSVAATGSWALRRARSQSRAASRWLVKRTLAIGSTPW